MPFTSLETLVTTLEHRPQWRSHQMFQQILTCWPQVVGDVVAVQTRPLSMHRQILSVSTSTPVWAQNLAFQRHHILSKLTEYVPDHQLKDIRFSPAKWLELSKGSSKGLGKQVSFGKGDSRLKNYHFEQSEARSLWSYHPSKLTPSPRLATPQKSEPRRQGQRAPVSQPKEELSEVTRPTASVPKYPSSSSASSPKLDGTPVETFHDWAAKIQKRAQRLPKCPRCQSPTPIGELQRWGVCSLCIAQDW